jgi:UDP-N-acetylglucosamine 2-epimerase
MSDSSMSDTFLEEFGTPAPDHMLGSRLSQLRRATARVMERIEPASIDERSDLVSVPGDVNSMLGATLVAEDVYRD